MSKTWRRISHRLLRRPSLNATAQKETLMKRPVIHTDDHTARNKSHERGGESERQSGFCLCTDCLPSAIAHGRFAGDLLLCVIHFALSHLMALDTMGMVMFLGRTASCLRSQSSSLARRTFFAKLALKEPANDEEIREKKSTCYEDIEKVRASPFRISANRPCTRLCKQEAFLNSSYPVAASTSSATEIFSYINSTSSPDVEYNSSPDVEEEIIARGTYILTVISCSTSTLAPRFRQRTLTGIDRESVLAQFGLAYKY